MSEPYDHQRKILDELKRNNKRRSLIVLPSGAGKTHTIAYDVRDRNPNKFLYIAHTYEILDQAIRIFKEVTKCKDYDIGLIDNKHKEYGAKYLFATIQTLVSGKNIENINSDIDYVGIDEFHHSGAATYQKILDYFKDAKFLVGMTATPFRYDGKDVTKYVDENVLGNVDVFQGIEDNILCPFEYHGLWDNIDYTKIRHEGFRYSVSDLERHLIIEKRNTRIYEEYVNRIVGDNRWNTIAFCVSTKHARKMNALFKTKGISSEYVSHTMKRELRESIVNDFRTKKIRVLFTVNILNEGVDFPECDSIMLLRPTYSKTVYLQQIGRGLRKSQWKKNVKILDFIGNYVKAFRVMDWLVGKEKQGSGEQMILNRKPVIKYNVPFPILFDTKVVKMMDFQRLRINKKYTQQDLIDDYNKVRKITGKDILSPKDILEFGSIAISNYQNYFGSWRTFLVDIMGITEKKIDVDVRVQVFKKKYFDLKEKLKNELIKKNRIFVLRNEMEAEYGRTFKDLFRQIGGYNNFLKMIGEKQKLICKICKNEFAPPISPRYGWHSKYCSQNCFYESLHRKHKKPDINRKCVSCGKEFTTAKQNRISCSQRCYLRYYRAKNKG